VTGTASLVSFQKKITKELLKKASEKKSIKKWNFWNFFVCLVV
jgi:hypothetical protein